MELALSHDIGLSAHHIFQDVRILLLINGTENAKIHRKGRSQIKEKGFQYLINL